MGLAYSYQFFSFTVFSLCLPFCFSSYIVHLRCTSEGGWVVLILDAPLFPSPTLRLAVRLGTLVTWESWARFMSVGGISLAMRARTGHSSADHREVRTALSLFSGRPSGRSPIFLWRVTCGRGLQSLKQVTSSLSFFFFFFVNRRSRLFL